MFEECLTRNAKKLFPLLHSFQGYHLVGGTALALQIDHRISYDFDLFTERPIDKNAFQKVKRVFFGEKIIPIFSSQEQRDYFISDVKMTLRFFPYAPLYALKKHMGIPLLSVKDIAAAKAFAIGQRAAYRDYIDMYFILKEGHATLSDVIRVAKKRFGAEFNGRLFLEQLVYLGDISDVKVEFLRNAVSRQTLIAFLKKEVRKHIQSLR